MKTTIPNRLIKWYDLITKYNKNFYKIFYLIKCDRSMQTIKKNSWQVLVLAHKRNVNGTFLVCCLNNYFHMLVNTSFLCSKHLSCSQNEKKRKISFYFFHFSFLQSVKTVTNAFTGKKEKTEPERKKSEEKFYHEEKKKYDKKEKQRRNEKESFKKTQEKLKTTSTLPLANENTTQTNDGNKNRALWLRKYESRDTEATAGAARSAEVHNKFCI